MPSDKIRVIAICVFRHGDRILVFEHYDKFKGTPYYRPLGGGVEFGETTEQALKREIKEEIAEEISDLKLLTVLENLFTLEGKPGHEIVYVYDGRFLDESAYRRDSFTVKEETETLKASWRRLDFFTDYHRLVPEALIPLLKTKS
jgi:8-oxo-dGTP pyrophosphatase MutT (NUDIX family)